MRKLEPYLKFNRMNLIGRPIGSHERGMGEEVHYQARFDHFALGRLSWSVWEYPVGIMNYKDTRAGDHKVVEDFDFGLEHDSEYEEWESYESPADPYNIFLASHRDATEILNLYGGVHGSDLVRRMVFVQYISIMESYLADALMNAVLGDKKALINMLEKNNDLKVKKYVLSDFYKDPSIIENEVRAYLRDVIYHNISKVDALYDLALNVKILDGKWSDLFKVINIRHDCVHRNGFSKDGIKIDIFDISYVASVGDLVKIFIASVEIKLNTKLDDAGVVNFLEAREQPSFD
jgi:hypothetical protein